MPTTDIDFGHLTEISIRPLGGQHLQVAESWTATDGQRVILTSRAPIFRCRIVGEDDAPLPKGIRLELDCRDDEHAPPQPWQSGGDVFAQPLRRRRNGHLTDAKLERISDIYRENFTSAPTLAVAMHYGVSHRSACNYVSAARKAGYLPQTTGGKKLI